MAPGYRASGQSRRANRGQVDHDIFEGLPVRNWSREFTTIAPPAHQETTTQKNKWDVDLPWGMPKDYQLLPQHSQDLLRLARSGKLYQKRPAQDDDEGEADPVISEKVEKKVDDEKEKGYVVKTWKALPKNVDRPDVEYLAKRRKGLRGSAVAVIAAVPTVTKATVRKTDAEGNTYVEEVLMTEGQTIEGEVISSTVIADPTLAPKPQATPQRRGRAPKKKLKGPGRGKKKIVSAPAVPPSGEAGAVKVEGEVQTDGTTAPAVGTEGVNGDLQPNGAAKAAENEDTQMDDVDDDEGDEGEDGDEGESGDDGEEGDDQDQDHDNDDEAGEDDTDAKPDGLTNPTIHDADKDKDVSSSPERPLSSSRPAFGHEQGSPLKHSTSANDIHAGQFSPHDDEAEAEGDDDDAEHGHDPRPNHSAHELELPAGSSSLYDSQVMETGGNAEDLHQQYDEDQEMLEFDDGDQHGTDIIHNEGFAQQQPFGYQGQVPEGQNPAETGFHHPSDQFHMPSSNDFAMEGMEQQHHDFDAEHPAPNLHGSHETGEAGEHTDTQDSFEDLLGNEEIGGPGDDGDDDLLAGLDKHLVESSGGPEEGVAAPEAPTETIEAPSEVETAKEPSPPTATEAITEPPPEPVIEPQDEPAAAAAAAPVVLELSAETTPIGQEDPAKVAKVSDVADVAEVAEVQQAVPELTAETVPEIDTAPEVEAAPEGEAAPEVEITEASGDAEEHKPVAPVEEDAATS